MSRKMSNSSELTKSKFKSFPWPCGRCMKNEVYPVTIPYTSSINHDGRVYSVHVPDLTVPVCRNCGECCPI